MIDWSKFSFKFNVAGIELVLALINSLYGLGLIRSSYLGFVGIVERALGDYSYVTQREVGMVLAGLGFLGCLNLLLPNNLTRTTVALGSFMIYVFMVALFLREIPASGIAGLYFGLAIASAMIVYGKDL